jgi:acylglycerol lipase
MCLRAKVGFGLPTPEHDLRRRHASRTDDKHDGCSSANRRIESAAAGPSRVCHHRKMPWYRPRQTHPTERHMSPFFHPLLPLPLPSRPTPPPPPPPPPAPATTPHPFTCALPPLGADTSRPPHTIGYNAHRWSDHYATLSPPTPRGHRLFLQRWLPRRMRPRGIVHVVHGLGDHSGKYAAVAKDLVRAGYAVLSHDAHGHGRSDGLRGHADSVMDYVDDAKRAIAEGDRRLPRRMAGLPRFLLGHSLGGAVAIHVVSKGEQTDWSGVILTAPAVSVYPKPILKLFAPVLATLAPLMPVQRLKFGKGKRKRPNRVADPLVVRAPVRARLGYEVLKSCESIMREAGQFQAPVLVAHSKGDRVTDAQGSVRFTSMVGSCDKTLLLYDGKAHDLLADGERRKVVVKDVVNWMGRRILRE